MEVEEEEENDLALLVQQNFCVWEEEDYGCGSWNCGRESEKRKRRIWNGSESEKMNGKRRREKKIRRRNLTVVSDELDQVSPLLKRESVKPLINPSW